MAKNSLVLNGNPGALCTTSGSVAHYWQVFYDSHFLSVGKVCVYCGALMKLTKQGWVEVE